MAKSVLTACLINKFTAITDGLGLIALKIGLYPPKLRDDSFVFRTVLIMGVLIFRLFR